MKPIYRKTLISVVVGALILGASFMGKSSMEKPKEVAKKPKTAASKMPLVNLMPVSHQKVYDNITVQGRLIASKKINIVAEVGGKIEQTGKTLKDGIRFSEGEMIVKIENKVQELSLRSAKASLMNVVAVILPDLKIDYTDNFETWKSYVDAFDVEQPIAEMPTPKSEQEKLFIASKNILNQYYNIRSQEEQLKKYSITAPFSGVLTTANVNAGAIISPGQNIGEFMNTASYELEVPIAQLDMKNVKTGASVQLVSEATGLTYKGRVQRFNEQINTQTQSVTAYISVVGKKLKEGMYLKGTMQGKQIEDVAIVPIESITDEQKVFVYKNEKLESLPIEVVKSYANHALVRGLNTGDKVLVDKIPTAYDGMSVKIASEIETLENISF